MNGTIHNTSGRFVVGLEYLPRSVGDCLPNDTMEEIVRRLLAYIRDNVENDIIRSEEPPQDKSKLWYVPSTKKLYEYNAATNAWEETNVDNISVCISPESDEALGKDEVGCLLLDLSKVAGATERFSGDITSDGSGNATKTVVLNDFEDGDASVEVMPMADLGTDGRWWVSDQQPTSVTLSFAGLAASTSFAIKVVVRKTT